MTSVPNHCVWDSGRVEECDLSAQGGENDDLQETLAASKRHLRIKIYPTVSMIRYA